MKYSFVMSIQSQMINLQKKELWTQVLSSSNTVYVLQIS